MTNRTPTAEQYANLEGLLAEEKMLRERTAQRLATALAEVERLGRSAASWEEDAKREHQNAHFWRQRAEAAEAEVERLRESDAKWIDWDIKCNVEMLDLRQRAEAAEASWQQAEAVIADQTAKLATAQQREAALREAARSALDSLHWPNYKAVCERLLGLDNAV